MEPAALEVENWRQDVCMWQPVLLHGIVAKAMSFPRKALFLAAFDENAKGPRAGPSGSETSRSGILRNPTSLILAFENPDSSVAASDTSSFDCLHSFAPTMV
ncbi:hypothetical protein LTR16_002527 [Cryomyces antarcticus]|uniref:Uncharacterized protein n=1 Tax=Cryomyces antarcticus TaxID=329879 RepID=A0ABR0LQZ4_9PEZI|nr:hypothetical protein LTR16_002527 [Cryomyces antarcticus]